MIKVEKDFTDIPTILTNKLREEAFDSNIASSSYCDTNNRYKVGSVQKRLNTIYNLKCAYCEKKLLDSPKHIEHYRPKKIYYWLAYSWDNLLLCCPTCNSIKLNKFFTKNSRVAYKSEKFCDIHNLSDSYNLLEEPMIVNPEKEDVLYLIYFDSDGKMYSEDERVHYTIEEACKLNRDELIQLRKQIVTDFINRVNKHYYLFKHHRNIKVFLPDIQTFKENCKKENEFYAFRNFVINNSELFFSDRGLQKIVKKLFMKL